MTATNLNPTTTMRPLVDLHPHPDNPRRGNVEAIAESLDANGQYAPIVALPDGTVLAGSHRLAAARSLGWTEMLVTTVEADEETARRILLADNRTSDLATYDDDVLAGLLSELSGDLTGTGYSVKEAQQLLAAIAGDTATIAKQYTSDVHIPQYQIVGELPDVEDLYDPAKTEELVAEIQASKLPDDLREFLLAAAQRHTVFNYRKIAEFYAHQNKNIQKLMEDSALVIIDFNDAMAKGYVKFVDRIEELRRKDAETWNERREA